MEPKYIIGIILIILIIFLLYKNSEHLTHGEAVANVAKVYADVSGTAYFNNLNAYNLTFKHINNRGSGKFPIVGNLDVSGTSTLKDLDVSGTSTFKGSVNINGVTNVSNFGAQSIGLNGVDIRTYLTGCILYDNWDTKSGNFRTYPIGTYSDMTYMFNETADFAVVNPGFIVDLYVNANFQGGHLTIINAGSKPLKVQLADSAVSTNADNDTVSYNTDSSTYSVTGYVGADTVSSMKVQILDTTKWTNRNPN